MCLLKTCFKINHLPHNVSTFKNLTHYITTFITESDYHGLVNIWRFNILLTSLTLESNPCSLRTRYVILYNVRCNVEPELTTLLPGSVWLIHGGFIAACLSQEVTRSLTCSPLSHFWHKKRKTVFVVREQKYIATQRENLLWSTLFFFFNIQYIIVKISFIVKNSVRLISYKTLVANI
jgi:hypothetical protein